jgi:hypothetical protein
VPDPKPAAIEARRVKKVRYVLASSVELIVGERLYRHRKRDFGVKEAFIPFSKVVESKGEH